MAETVVHVTTLEQWKSVLDVWFKKGYKWNTGDTEYSGHLLRGNKYLVLQFFEGSHYIHCTDEGLKSIEYSELMAHQKEDKEVKTYYVTKEQLELIEDLKNTSLPLYRLVNSTSSRISSLAQNIPGYLDRPLLRYIGGDETIEFKVKEQLYRLWRGDDGGNRIYMQINGLGTPIWTTHKYEAFTAPLEEIKQWVNPAWEIEKVD